MSVKFEINREIVQGGIIIIVSLCAFGIRMFKLWRAKKTAKENPETSNIEALKVKNLQAMTITGSDTVFKILTAVAIIIGSSYSGSEDCGDDGDQECRSPAYFWVFWASMLGVSEEVIDVFDQVNVHY